MEIPETLTRYPVFRPQQVLTEKQLNEVVSYLKGQDLLTRTALIGTGIVCGLRVSTNSGHTELTVSEGCGVTSLGNVIDLKTTTFTHYRSYKLKDGELPGTTSGLEGIYELFTADQAEVENETAIEADRVVLISETHGGVNLSSILDELVVIQFLSEVDILPKKCTTNCDELASSRAFISRTLVTNRTFAEQIVRAGYDIAGGTTLENFFQGHLLLPDLSISRFGWVPGKEMIDLTRIDSHQDFIEVLEEACSSSNEEEARKLFAEIGKAFRQAARLWSNLCEGCRPDSEGDFAELEDHLNEAFDQLGKEEFRYLAQYFHTHLQHLIDAYRELRTTTWDLVADCLPDPMRHPYHLMLGEVKAPAGWDPSVFRTPYLQPPVYNLTAARLEEARILYERLKRLAREFKLPKAEQIRITPSRQASTPIGLRAIPFYYPEKLAEVWNPEFTRRRRTDLVPSYYLPSTDLDAPSPALLTHDLHGYDFYRIEGHTALHPSEALKSILTLRERFNLAFDVVLVKAGLTPESEDIQNDFLILDLELLYATLRDALRCLLKSPLFDKGPVEERKVLLAGLEPMGGDAAGEFSTLERLAVDNLFEQFSKLHKTIFDWAEKTISLRDCTPKQVEPLLKAYEERVRILNEMLTLKEFARIHPGLERLDGVPRGGTFVLVYADPADKKKALLKAEKRALANKGEARDETLSLRNPSERRSARVVTRKGTESEPMILAELGENVRAEFLELKERVYALGDAELKERVERLAEAMESSTEVVIGDFCLPYRCCNKMPGVTYVVARPRPVVMLDKTSYCIDDPGPYAFTLHPPGGVLRGPGVDSSSGQYRFIPSSDSVREVPADFDGKRLVTFNYFADGGIDSFTVTVLPVPNADFRIGKLGDNGVVCSTPEKPASPVALVPRTPGGTFSADQDVLVEEDKTWYFDPNKAKPGEPVTIEYTIEASENTCPATIVKKVTVVELPDAHFTSEPEMAEQTCVVPGEAPRKLTPVTPGGEWIVLVDDQEPGDAFKITDEGAEIDLYRILVERKKTSAAFVISYAVGDTPPCTASEEMKGEMFIAPDPAFEMEPPGPYTKDSGEIKLIPKVQGDGYGNTFTGKGVIEGWYFIPGQVDLADKDEAIVTIRHEITDKKTGCTSTAVRRATVRKG